VSLYPKARPLSTRLGSPRQKCPSVGISLWIPFGSIYPHFDPENYPHCPHPYPQDTLISTFLHVDKVVEKACERLPPVLWARDRCGSLPQIMRSGHVAGQRGPSCKIEDDLFSVPLFLFRQREKAAEKEKLNWGNGNSGRIAYIRYSSLGLHPFFQERVRASNGFLYLSRLFPLLLHQELVRDEGDEFAIRRFVVLAVDVVAEEGVQVLFAWATPRPKRFIGLLVALFFTGLLVTGS